jgi:hypothetical protein
LSNPLVSKVTSNSIHATKLIIFVKQEEASAHFSKHARRLYNFNNKSENSEQGTWKASNYANDVRQNLESRVAKLRNLSDFLVRIQLHKHFKF